MSKKDKPYLRVVRDTDRLTGKQEAFAQQVAKGSVLSDAYREAYDAENMKDKTIWEEACKLAREWRQRQDSRAIRRRDCRKISRPDFRLTICVTPRGGHHADDTTHSMHTSYRVSLKQSHSILKTPPYCFSSPRLVIKPS